MNALTKTGVIAASAAAAVAALPLLASAAPTPAPVPTYQYEKCYGVNASGKNDCGAAGVHSCAGESRTVNDPKSWIYVPTGTCAKIQGGSTSPKA
jgi:uncharacterized membrane protein